VLARNCLPCSDAILGMARFLALCAVLIALAGCGALEEPRNRAALDSGGGYQNALRDFGDEDEAHTRVFATALRGRVPLSECRANTQYDRLPLLAPNRDEAPISKGDLLRVTIGDDTMLSGDFEIEGEGLLRLPRMPAFLAHGVAAPTLERRIRKGLVEERLYRGDGPPVSIAIIERASIRVYVRGAAFEAGVAEINVKAGEGRDTVRQAASGDLPNARTVSAALRAVAGVRPDADVQRIVIRRDGRAYRVDMKPAAIGRRFFDPSLLADDEIEVPSMGCFQPGLARPGAITRPGIKANLSNLTQPAQQNSAAAIDDDVREMKYGTTLLQAVFRMNCVGGVAATNASRHVVLATQNPITGEMEVIRRAIEDLIRRADRDEHNPILMPGDSIGCYDSTVTNVRDVLSSFGDMGVPLAVLGLL